MQHRLVKVKVAMLNYHVLKLYWTNVVLNWTVFFLWTRANTEHKLMRCFTALYVWFLFVISCHVLADFKNLYIGDFLQD